MNGVMLSLCLVFGLAGIHCAIHEHSCEVGPQDEKTSLESALLQQAPLQIRKPFEPDRGHPETNTMVPDFVSKHRDNKRKESTSAQATPLFQPGSTAYELAKRTKSELQLQSRSLEMLHINSSEKTGRAFISMQSILLLCAMPLVIATFVGLQMGPCGKQKQKAETASAKLAETQEGVPPANKAVERTGLASAAHRPSQENDCMVSEELQQSKEFAEKTVAPASKACASRTVAPASKACAAPTGNPTVQSNNNFDWESLEKDGTDLYMADNFEGAVENYGGAIKALEASVGAEPVSDTDKKALATLYTHRSMALLQDVRKTQGGKHRIDEPGWSLPAEHRKLAMRACADASIATELDAGNAKAWLLKGQALLSLSTMQQRAKEAVKAFEAAQSSPDLPSSMKPEVQRWLKFAKDEFDKETPMPENMKGCMLM